MASMTHIKWLGTPGKDGAFHAPEEWRAEIRQAGIRCPECEGIRPEARYELRVVIVSEVPRTVVVGLVGSVWGGIAVRSDLIELIGTQKLQDLCRFVPMVDLSGAPIPDFRFLIEREPRGVFRGSEESTFGFCRECDRFMYSAARPEYLLRRYWDGRDQITLFDHQILCTTEYFRDVIGPRHLPGRLKGESRALVDEPSDGLPADYREMLAEIRRRGLIK